MTKEITLPQPILFILYSLQKAGHEAYVVGGAVRDILLDRPLKDWDFTTNATPEQIQAVFPKNFYDNEYGTVGIASEHLFEHMAAEGWTSDAQASDNTWADQIFEVTTFRSETGYTDRRRPDQVTWGTSIDEDMSRRDFTINAMAISVPSKSKDQETAFLNGLLPYAKKEPEITLEVTIIDPYEGAKDLEKNMVRAVGQAGQRFEEDALRMLRAIRFCAKLGFRIEPDTFKAIEAHHELIKYVSFERIRDELLSLLVSPHAADGIIMLAATHLLDHIMPELLPMQGIKQGGHHIYDVWKHSIESLRHCPSTDPIVRLATLLHDVGKPPTVRYQGPRGVTFYGHEVVGARIAKKIAIRLRLSNKDVDRIFTLVRWHMFMYEPKMTDASIRRFIRRVGLENINDMMLLRVSDRKGGGSKATSWRLRELQERIGEQLYEPLSLKDLKINGHDLMEQLKLQPGPMLGKILNTLFDEIIEDTSKNDREYLLSRAKQLIEGL